MNLRPRLLAFTFAVLLLLPMLDQALGLSIRFSSTENRQVQGMPALNFPHVRSFVHQFDRYYKENFGWRNALFYAYSRWKFNMLGLSPLPEKVVVGKNGWFYLGNSYNKVIDQHRGLQPLSADSARRIADHLINRQQELAQQGAQLYIFIAPDSHTIYPEYLPDHLQQSPAPSRLDILKEAINKTTLRFVDIRDTLRAAKRNHVVYYQTDTHWNEYGTLIGCAALLNRIRLDQPTVAPVRLSDYHIEQQRGGAGDLTTMLTLQDEQKDPLYYYIKPVPNRMGRQTALIPNEALGFPSTRFTGPGSGRLLFVGDSFSHGMMGYLPGYFRESYFVRSNQLDPILVKTERPTVVVIEIVERNINKLATF
ncbi:alginate O-acetyltransferase AlgX-related protein [Spirosoma flavum]|uniref:AlgX/AlgJ SGNH hydrolase-like domain-containing protein n=1 Tax=Spirosoma flavum TaxID=2048557 RepID=A0ABW6AC72_9BACT